MKKESNIKNKLNENFTFFIVLIELLNQLDVMDNDYFVDRREKIWRWSI